VIPHRIERARLAGGALEEALGDERHRFTILKPVEDDVCGNAVEVHIASPHLRIVAAFHTVHQVGRGSHFRSDFVPEGALSYLTKTHTERALSFDGIDLILKRVAIRGGTIIPINLDGRSYM
jgi:hypothetical protein